jgi:hypothetical protein
LTAFAMLFMQLRRAPMTRGTAAAALFFEIQAKSGRKL